MGDVINVVTFGLCCDDIMTPLELGPWVGHIDLSIFIEMNKHTQKSYHISHWGNFAAIWTMDCWNGTKSNIVATKIFPQCIMLFSMLKGFDYLFLLRFSFYMCSYSDLERRQNFNCQHCNSLWKMWKKLLWLKLSWNPNHSKQSQTHTALAY